MFVRNGFSVELGLRNGGEDTPEGAYPHDETIGSDDPRYPQLGELVEVRGIEATTGLDDEW